MLSFLVQSGARLLGKKCQDQDGRNMRGDGRKLAHKLLAL